VAGEHRQRPAGAFEARYPDCENDARASVVIPGNASAGQLTIMHQNHPCLGSTPGQWRHGRLQARKI
jgi:hypothetical protein